jgi:hypothetical protein
MFSCLSCTSHFLVFSSCVLVFELHNLVLFLVSKLDLNLFLAFVLMDICVFNELTFEWLCLICDYFATTIIFAPLCYVGGLGLELLVHLIFFASLVISSTPLFDSPKCLISFCKTNYHYEKSRLLKPHYPAVKTQKKSYIITL